MALFSAGTKTAKPARRVWLVGLMVLVRMIAPAARGELKVPSRDVPEEWLTPAERSGFRETPSYDETVRYCRRLAAASDKVRYTLFGVSPESREMPLLIASQDGRFDPDGTRSAGKLVVLLQNGIHAGECEGKDASLMLLRDMAITKTREELLEHVILLVMPIFNIDGHERFSRYSRINQNGPDRMGWRVTSRNLNLNRDYMKADTVEMRAWLKVWNDWTPDLHIDTHTTDGGDWQYDLTYSVETNPVADAHVADWLRRKFYGEVVPALERDGHVTTTYFSLVDPLDPSQGIRRGGFAPRYSTGYASIRNRPSILVETHMLKPYRTRVIAQYNLILHVLETLNRDPGSLHEAVHKADADTEAAGKRYDPKRRVPLSIRRTDASRAMRFKGVASRTEASTVSGAKRIVYDGGRPVELEVPVYDQLEVKKSVVPPLAYIIPAQWTEVISLVRFHGLKAEMTTESFAFEVERYRFRDVSFAERPFEGRFRVRYATDVRKERVTYPRGSVIVPLDQPAAKVAIHLLEPEAPDSLVSWGFFTAIFEQKEYAERYILEALARDMLNADPELKQEFEKRIRADSVFAADPQARLDFFYRRSPYWDELHNVYPVGRLLKAAAVMAAPL